LWQTVGFAGDVAANLTALENTAAAAAAAGAALLLCPECWLCGYNIGAALEPLAESAEGPSAQAIAALSRRFGIAIAYGYAEREPDSHRIFNAAQVIGADGAPLARYRKTHLFGADERAYYTPGECFEAPFAFAGLRLGLLICYDIEFPEAARSLTLAGADALLVPTALTDEYRVVPQLLVPARCVENQIHVAYCNHAGIENGMRFLGGSCLVGPDGNTVVAAGADDALIIGEISQRTRAAGLKSFPYRNDRRPELYRRLQQPLI
jgi:predicted amidohydrolase